MSEELINNIQKLKAKRNAVILAHNYQPGEVQDIADFVGDSLELSRKAAEVKDADVIVFCGVYFMAETAAILSPNKTVLIPDENAGCPMADMITAEELRELKAKHPGAETVCYVNSTAAVKAECDCCCTSANADKVINSIPEDREIIFVPDQFLGQHVMEQTGRKLILHPGYCPTHARIQDTDIINKKKEHPEAVALTHPECPGPVRKAADHVLSTGGMLRFVKESDKQAFIIATENDMIYRLKKDCPEKTFHSVSERAVCPNMKKITLEKVLWSLQDMKPQVTVPPDIREPAKQAIVRMLDIV